MRNISFHVYHEVFQVFCVCLTHVVLFSAFCLLLLSYGGFFLNSHNTDGILFASEHYVLLVICSFVALNVIRVCAQTEMISNIKVPFRSTADKSFFSPLSNKRTAWPNVDSMRERTESGLVFYFFSFLG